MPLVRGPSTMRARLANAADALYAATHIETATLGPRRRALLASAGGAVLEVGAGEGV